MTQERKIGIIVWFAILMSVVLYAVIISLIKVEPKEIAFNKNIFLVLGGIFAILPYLMKYFKPLQIAVPFGVVIAEIPAILGLAVYFAFSDKSLAYRLIAISFVSILFLFPAENKSEKNPDDFQNPPPIE